MKNCTIITSMMVQFYRNNFICFLLVQLTFVLFVQGFPERLTVKIQDGQEIITLNWMKTDRSVANSNLPIWSARRLKDPELIPNVMEEIGPFAMYHDLQRSSAIILLQHQQRIFGVVDTRFWISGLPLSEVEPDRILQVGTFIQKRRVQNQFHDEDSDFPPMNIIDLTYINSFLDEWLASASQESPVCPTDVDNANILSSLRVPGGSVNRPRTLSGSSSISNPEPSTSQDNKVDLMNDQTGETMYAEILVLVSNNVVRYATKRHPDLRPLVLYYLIHFNAIDMLMAKLKPHINVHINLAGMLLESEIFVFPYAFGPSDERPLRVIDGAETLRRIPRYLKQYQDIFPRDSFDFFYLATRYMIQDEKSDSSIHDSSDMSSHSSSFSYDSMTDFVPCDGISRIANMYENRWKKTTEYEVPGLIVERKSVHGDYITAAHEIAHLMHVDHDLPSEGNKCDGGQCYAILQEAGTYCRFCIRWSDRSIREFKRYASTNVDHCFLLNSPRSLHPRGSILRTLGPDQQCRCYKYTSRWTGVGFADMVNPRGCNVMLLCAHQNRLVTNSVPKPIDGTPCGSDKVCWKGKCENEYSPNPFGEWM